MDEVNNIPFDETYKKFAGLLKRFCSSLVDAFIFGLPAYILLVLSIRLRLANPGIRFKEPFLSLWVLYLGLIIASPVFCIIFTMGKYGMTPGQKTMGLKIVRESGKPISYWVAAGRCFFSMLYGIKVVGLGAILGIVSVIMIVTDRKKQALHDKVSLSCLCFSEDISFSFQEEQDLSVPHHKRQTSPYQELWWICP